MAFQSSRLLPGMSWKKKRNPCQETFDAFEGQLGVQQWIQFLSNTRPENVRELLKKPAAVDESAWIYEHLRQVVLQLNLLVCKLANICDVETCPQMIATEDWTYLCAAHPEPKECCAIDYITHTLDGSSVLLTSPKYFPSRVSFNSNATGYFRSASRRLYRIFAHAYFHHNQAFEEFENETHLTERFLVMVNKFKLVPKKLQIIPITLLIK